MCFENHCHFFVNEILRKTQGIMSPSPKKKKPKHLWTLTERLRIIEMRDNGAAWVKIAQEMKTNESSIRTIYANKDKTLVPKRKGQELWTKDLVPPKAG